MVLPKTGALYTSKRKVYDERFGNYEFWYLSRKCHFGFLVCERHRTRMQENESLFVYGLPFLNIFGICSGEVYLQYSVIFVIFSFVYNQRPIILLCALNFIYKQKCSYIISGLNVWYFIKYNCVKVWLYKVFWAWCAQFFFACIFVCVFT